MVSKIPNAQDPRCNQPSHGPRRCKPNEVFDPATTATYGNGPTIADGRYNYPMGGLSDLTHENTRRYSQALSNLDHEPSTNERNRFQASILYAKGAESKDQRRFHSWLLRSNAVPGRTSLDPHLPVRTPCYNFTVRIGRTA